MDPGFEAADLGRHGNGQAYRIGSLPLWSQTIERVDRVLISIRSLGIRGGTWGSLGLVLENC